MEEKRAKILPIDRGWAWVVVLASAGLFGLHAGGFKCQGILLVELQEKYEGVYVKSTLLWVLTMKYIITGMLGPLASLLIVKTSHRSAAMFGILLETVSFIGLAYSNSLTTMFLFFSVPGGIGNSALALSPLLVSGQYFRKRKALALGVISSGSGIGTITIPFILRPLFVHFNFSGGAVLFGGFCLQFMILASLLRPISYYESIHRKELEQLDAGGDESKLQENEAEHRKSLRIGSGSKVDGTSQHIISTGDLVSSAVFVFENQDGDQGKVSTVTSTDHFNWRVILMPKFLLFAASICTYAFGTCVVYSGVPPLGEECGISKDTIAVAMIMAGCLEIPCRIANGFLADKKIMSATLQYTLCLFIAGLMTLLNAIISGLPGIALVLIGMSTVGTSIFSLVPEVLRELVGAENITSGMGLQIFFQSTAFIGSTFIAGAIHDYTNSWQMVYFYIASMMMLGSLVMWPYCIYQLCQRQCARGREKEGKSTS